MEIVI